MNNTANKISSALLKIKAVKLSAKEPFTWASGWKSPIYCDNRKTLSYPSVRALICESFASYIKEYYPETEVIAGVATGAIAHGVLVAEALGLPFVYVRSAAKSHGLENLVEGDLQANSKVVVIEDLISTGGSSIAAVESLRKAGANVLGLLAIFSYEFKVAEDNFKKANCCYKTLSCYSILLEEALKDNYIAKENLETLRKWREKPDKYEI